MRKTILFGATLWLTATLSAQNTQPVVILQTTGKIAVISEGKKKANPVVAGAVVNPKSSLKLAKGASVQVYCGGQYKTIKDTEKVDLTAVCGNGTAAKKLDVDYDLGEKIMAAVDMVAVAKARGDGWVRGVTNPSKGGDGWGTGVTNPSKGGDGWGTGVTNPSKGGDGWGTGVTNPSKGGDGWGGKGTSIQLVMPFGLVRKGLVCFNWSKPNTQDPYRLEMLDEKGGLVHAQTVKDTFICLDLASINLVPGKPYTWRVKVDGAKKMMSNELKFGLGDPKEYEEALHFANSTSLVGNAELVALSKATALEKYEWFYDAQLVYADLQKNKPSNLAKMMHAAFWRRFGFNLLSEKATTGAM